MPVMDARVSRRISHASLRRVRATGGSSELRARVDFRGSSWGTLLAHFTRRVGGINAKEETMLSLTVTLLIIAIIAAILGFGGLAGTAVGFAKIAFFVFIILALLSFVFRGGRGTVA
jgi:uncharacterized membrane protein YtjA (UPF0391 family)